ncbi:MAG TPA: hypothetical protein VGC77_10115 [Rhodopseudomonas sp.]|uniref:ArnT family glycosyltransferase n=1 Tax=Rhodopseudomonas sp. TaxID=1078 RepID=UPI002EDA580A
MIRPAISAAGATALLALCCALLFWRWQALDQRPPKFDESSYLLAGLIEYKALLSGSLSNFIHAYLTVDPGRGGLPSLLTLPGFLLFGPSPDAAIAIFVLFWPLAIFALYDATKTLGMSVLGLSAPAAAISGFLGCLLFAIYPATQYLSNTFLIEFPLITFVLLGYAAGLRYFQSGSRRWALLFGAAVLGCVLAKVTAPAFLIGPALPILWRWTQRRAAGEILIGLALIALPSLLLAAPSYVINWRAVLETTRFLSSAGVAAVYAKGGAGDPIGALRFIWRLLNGYEFLLCALALSAAVGYGLICRAAPRLLFLAMTAAGFVLPLAIVALSNFKDERYAYPGYGPLFLGAGLGLGLLWTARSRASRVLIGASLLAPLINAALVAALLPEAMRLPLSRYPLEMAPPSPDRRDWHVAEIVAETETLTTGGPIYQLGGSPAFHAALFNFVSLLRGNGRSWTGFPFQSFPRLTAADIENSAEQTAYGGALLYKSPPYDPEFLGRFSSEVIAAMVSKGFSKTELHATQPDGSRFFLLRPPFPNVEITSRQPPGTPPSGLLFGHQYAVTAVNFRQSGDQLIAELALRRTGPPLPAEAMFFHLIDANGIVGGLDRPLCSGCADSAAVTEWIERFPIPQLNHTTPIRIGFGVYSPPAPSLKITGGPTDWDGLRAIVDLPKHAAQN